MGQRSNPIGLRLNIIRAADSRWFATDKKMYSEFVMQDKTMRDTIKEQFNHAGLSRIIINRSNVVIVTITVAYAGAIIGKKGVTIDALKDELSAICGSEVRINIKEVKKPDADAQIVSDMLAKKIQGQGNFKTHVKFALQAAMRSGALGIKVIIKGRINGGNIARFEEFTEGSVPMQTLRAQVNYGRATSRTTSGAIGVKVWVYTGIVLHYDPFEGTDESFGTSVAAPVAQRRTETAAKKTETKVTYIEGKRQTTTADSETKVEVKKYDGVQKNDVKPVRKPASTKPKVDKTIIS